MLNGYVGLTYSYEVIDYVLIRIYNRLYNTHGSIEFSHNVPFSTHEAGELSEFPFASFWT